MKKYLTLILFVVFSVASFGQTESNTYIIKFKDKSNSKFSIAEPRMYLSDRSIERRLLQQIPLNETDLPVNPDYLDEVKQSGGDIFYTSKWLNLAIARVDKPEVVSRIRNLPFVKEITSAELIKQKKNTPFLKNFFQSEKFQKIDAPKTMVVKSGTSGFDYGVAANQVQMLKVDQLHSQGYTGKGMIIGVMDAGYCNANNLNVFDSLFLNNRILGTRDFVQPGNNVYNPNLSTHGTMVLSTMGANLPGQMVGTAPHASYYLFRTEDADDEYLMEEYYWVAAAEYADSLGVDVFNTSLGYTTFPNYPSDNHTYSDMDGNTTPITIGADLAASKGILVVNSAGNSGGSPWLYISAPADGDSVLAVGAVDPNGIYAGFSSIGPTSDGRTKPDVMAQGGPAAVVYPFSGDLVYFNGTSFSSPILCGAATCLWQANPDFNNMQIIQAIKQSASISAGPNNYYGWGIPDMMMAHSILVGNNDHVPFNSIIKCYPNPFTDFIVAEFYIPTIDQVELVLFNSQGTVLKKYTGKTLNTGENHIKLENLSLLPRGIYFLQISTPWEKITHKIIK